MCGDIHVSKTLGECVAKILNTGQAFLAYDCQQVTLTPYDFGSLAFDSLGWGFKVKSACST